MQRETIIFQGEGGNLFANLAGRKAFKKLDAYQQIPLDEASKLYVAIHTHRGLYNCLSFGASAPPGIFQRMMENLLNRIAHVSIY